jgi:hypothetical protein
MRVSRQRLRLLGRLSLVLCNLVVALLLVAMPYVESRVITG